MACDGAVAEDDVDEEEDDGDGTDYYGGEEAGRVAAVTGGVCIAWVEV